jgi:hypothetical protein
MRDKERIAYRSAVVLRNVGRCPTCGGQVQLPCAACTHPKRLRELGVERERELLKRTRR